MKSIVLVRSCWCHGSSGITICPTYPRTCCPATMKISLLSAALLLYSHIALAQLVPVAQAEFAGNLVEARDLSAAQLIGDYLAIASDEGTVMQLLRREDEAFYQVVQDVPLLPREAGEIDMEALAAQGDTVYVLGSHSLTRNRARHGLSRAKNREQLGTIAIEPARDKIFRFRVDTVTAKPGSAIESASLRPLLEVDPLLGLFANTPGKENGVDFEGLAVAGGRLYLGLRGPVLRGNYVPVLSMAFEDIGLCNQGFDGRAETCGLVFVDLAGRGIRSLHSVSDGFLILAGPVNDGNFSYQVYFWDGGDCLPDKGNTACQLLQLGEVPRKERTGAEGLAVLEESVNSWRIMVVYDGVDGGAPALFQVARPQLGPATGGSGQ
jgi:Protein of unknown function (DUF3616)